MQSKRRGYAPQLHPETPSRTPKRQSLPLAARNDIDNLLRGPGNQPPSPRHRFLDVTCYPRDDEIRRLKGKDYAEGILPLVRTYTLPNGEEKKGLWSE